MKKYTFMILCAMLMAGCESGFIITNECTKGTATCLDGKLLLCVSDDDISIFLNENNIHNTDAFTSVLTIECKNGCDGTNACLCPNTCTQGCNTDGSCKTAECKNGTDGSCITTECKNGNDNTGACICPNTCIHGCNTDGSCITTECKNGNDNTGACICPNTCIHGCNTDGSCRTTECKNGNDNTGACICP
ncbi:MAG: hypothetical protein IKY83_00720, partial [Proteobacteria bacterium]|nr:hypothetical protein [Pseudomonadota bacterium]